MSERITLAQLAAISMLTERTLRSYLKPGPARRGEDAGRLALHGGADRGVSGPAAGVQRLECAAERRGRGLHPAAHGHNGAAVRRARPAGRGSGALPDCGRPCGGAWRDHGFQRRCGALARDAARPGAGCAGGAAGAVRLFPRKILPDFRLKFRRDFYYAVGKEVQTMDLKNWYDRVREQLDRLDFPALWAGFCTLPVCPVHARHGRSER